MTPTTTTIATAAAAAPATQALRPINNARGNLLTDSLTMFKRCMLLNMRNPDGVGMAIVSPFLMMVLFGLIFGGATAMGRADYINFVAPAIMLISIGQSMIFTAISINKDLKTGIIDRYRSMPIAQPSILVGHALASIVRSVIVALVVLGGALLVGFRPEASVGQWLIVTGLFLLFALAMTWIAILVGLSVKSEEAASSSVSMISLLPYLSSGFAPTETLPVGFRQFAEHQPLTPMVDAARALMMGGSTSNGEIGTAVIWWTAFSVIAAIIAIQAYSRKLAK